MQIIKLNYLLQYTSYHFLYSDDPESHFFKLWQMQAEGFIPSVKA